MQDEPRRAESARCRSVLLAVAFTALLIVAALGGCTDSEEIVPQPPESFWIRAQDAPPEKPFLPRLRPEADSFVGAALKWVRSEGPTGELDALLLIPISSPMKGGRSREVAERARLYRKSGARTVIDSVEWAEVVAAGGEFDGTQLWLHDGED